MEDLEVVVKEKGLQDVIKFQYPSVSKSHKERLEMLDVVVSDDFEGLVHYQLDDVYLFGTRASTTCKSKPRYASEAYCTGVEKCKNGEGKLLLRACDELGGVEFTAMMKGSHAERMYDNQLNFIGQWLTFEYEELSDKGCPTKGVVQETRLCNIAGQPLE